jgi:tetratricopeptide (TPR) repeat protein
MLAQGGQSRAALAVFERHAKALDARFGHQRRIEEADLYCQLGARDQAELRLDHVAGAADVTPFLLLQAGLGYRTAGNHAKAASALQRAASAEPIADYHLALLKLQQGDTDTCLQLLERAAAARPAEVRQLLVHESAAWSAVAATERFHNVLGPRAATPVR